MIERIFVMSYGTKSIALSLLHLLCTISGYAQNTPTTVREVDDVMLRYMHEHNIPGGALVVVKNGNLVYGQGYGVANPTSGAPFLPTSVGRIASISKVFTGMAIMNLVKAGKLQLDQPAFPYLGLTPFLKPGTSEDPRMRTITIRQLLEHRSGLDNSVSGDSAASAWNVANDMHIPSPASADDTARHILGMPLGFTPGAKESYTNMGYNLLGRIIAKVSGQSYESYVQENLLRPLGIHAHISKSLADPHSDEVSYSEFPPRQKRSVYGNHDQAPSPYGGVCYESGDSAYGWAASAVDIARLTSQLVRPNPFIDEQQRRSLIYAKLATSYPCYADSGARIYADSIEKYGAAPGSCSGFTYLVQSDTLFVLLFNSERVEAGQSFATEVRSLIIEAIKRVPSWPSRNLFLTYYLSGVSTVAPVTKSKP
jgi:CubicO group peptidase (beta-lactamase class C family)